ncbi:MAG: transposase [Planctomycetota bacterium]
MARKSKPINVVKQIRKSTARKFSAEDKIRIVLEGLRGELPITELCRKEGISAATYYKWSKDFLDGGKNGLTLQTKRNATSEEVIRLKSENEDLKKALADAMLDLMRYKKSFGL